MRRKQQSPPGCTVGISERRRRHRHGFTLIEALVSLIMFGIITAALAIALTTALHAQSASEQRQEENGAARALFDAITKDIQASYASSNDASNVFIAGSGQGAGTTASGSGGGLLTLTTLAHRLQTGDLFEQAANTTTSASTPADSLPPQSNTVLVRYDQDSASGTVTRSVVTVPNSQLLDSVPPGPDIVLARNVVSLTFQFYDPNQQTWRPDWDYEQANQQSSASGTGASGTQNSAAASGTGTSSTTQNTATGDSTLPSAVQVTVVFASKSGQPLTYTTEIPIVATQPYTDPSKQAGGAGGTGGGGGAAGSNNGGGTANP